MKIFQLIKIRLKLSLLLTVLVMCPLALSDVGYQFFDYDQYSTEMELYKEKGKLTADTLEIVRSKTLEYFNAAVDMQLPHIAESAKRYSDMVKIALTGLAGGGSHHRASPSHKSSATTDAIRANLNAAIERINFLSEQADKEFDLVRIERLEDFTKDAKAIVEENFADHGKILEFIDKLHENCENDQLNLLVIISMLNYRLKLVARHGGASVGTMFEPEVVFRHQFRIEMEAYIQNDSELKVAFEKAHAQAEELAKVLRREAAFAIEQMRKRLWKSGQPTDWKPKSNDQLTTEDFLKALVEFDLPNILFFVHNTAHKSAATPISSHAAHVICTINKFAMESVNKIMWEEEGKLKARYKSLAEDVRGSKAIEMSWSALQGVLTNGEHLPSDECTPDIQEKIVAKFKELNTNSDEAIASIYQDFMESSLRPAILPRVVVLHFFDYILVLNGK